MFEPQLPHHRAEFERVGKQRLPVFGTAIVLIVLISFFAPVHFMGILIPTLLVSLGLAFGVIEAKLFLIFRRDLLERRANALDHKN